MTRSIAIVLHPGFQLLDAAADIWTSAGISAGIDLAIALIEDDLGPDVGRRVAQQLVVHQRRPGSQSQSSALGQPPQALRRVQA